MNMTDPTTLSAAFLLGLFSTVHCVGMCGGIIGALSLSLPLEVRSHKAKMLTYITTYNIGRIASYAIAGLIVGTLGHGLNTMADLGPGRLVVRYAGTVLMIAIGLYLAGWFPQFSLVEKIGQPVWRKLEPLGRKLLPVSSLPRALAYGMIWGWLPCGLVYFVLLWSLTSGGATQGALTMLAFGVGTLPTLIVTGFAASGLATFVRNPRVRQITGLLIIAMAIGSLFIPMHMKHMNHTNMDNSQPMDTNQMQHMTH